MAPSSSSTMLTAASSTSSVSDGADNVVNRSSQQTHPDEPNLYLYPAGIFPEYRPLPLLVKIGAFLVSSMILFARNHQVVTSSASAAAGKLYLQPIAMMRAWKDGDMTRYSIWKIIGFLVKVGHHHTATLT